MVEGFRVLDFCHIVLEIVRHKLDHALRGVQLGSLLTRGFLLPLLQQEAGIIQQCTERVVKELTDGHLLPIVFFDVRQ